MGFLYYVIYNPFRCDNPRLEVYKLVNNAYELHDGDRVWLPEIGLAIGIEQGTYLGIPREWLYWYDEQGERFLTPEEHMKQAQQQALQAQQVLQAQQEAQQARRRAELLAERL